MGGWLERGESAVQPLLLLLLMFCQLLSLLALRNLSPLLLISISQRTALHQLPESHTTMPMPKISCAQLVTDSELDCLTSHNLPETMPSGVSNTAGK